MSENKPSQRHPLLSLALLVLLMLIGSVVFSFLGIAVAAAFLGLNTIANTADAAVLKILQTALALGTFLFPALFFARLSGEGIGNFLKTSTRVYPVLLLLTVAVLFASAAPLTWLIEFNKQLSLPDFLKGIEAWMQLKEKETAELVKILSQMRGPGDLVLALLMMAILPAIGEEMVFRGIIQKIFTNWTHSAHWGIWISAILFSAIHLQFYGFLPRMMLGALFGYLLLWGNSLWLPILAHFINNATVVFVSYWQQTKGLPLEQLEEPTNYPVYIYLINTLLTVATLYVFYQYAKLKANTNNTAG